GRVRDYSDGRRGRHRHDHHKPSGRPQCPEHAGTGRPARRPDRVPLQPRGGRRDLHGGGGEVVRGRGGHRGASGEDGDRRPLVHVPGRLRRDRGLREADDCGGERLRPRRGLRALHGLRHQDRLGERPLRAAGARPLHHPGRGRHPAPRPSRRQGQGDRDDPDRPCDRRHRGPPNRPRHPGDGPIRPHGRRPRDGRRDPQEGPFSRPPRQARRSDGLRDGPEDRARRGTPRPGHPLRHPRQAGGHLGLSGEARAEVRGPV
ncbi:MAG: 3-hydroxybutyryl-CoA dehydratase, partial [uncultured Rubrobacteraceae bacterium]